MSEPTTEAGKQMFRILDGLMAVMHGIATADLPENIAAAAKTTDQVKAELEKLVVAIEKEARAAGLAEVYGYHDIHLRDLRAKVVELEDPRHEPPWFDDDHIVRSDVLDLIDRAIHG